MYDRKDVVGCKTDFAIANRRPNCLVKWIIDTKINSLL